MPLSKLYVTPLDGFVMVIVPVATKHVGWVTEVTGTEGVAGGAFTVFATAVEAHVETSSLTITW